LCHSTCFCTLVTLFVNIALCASGSSAGNDAKAGELNIQNNLSQPNILMISS
jgi:hypothetical protein